MISTCSLLQTQHACPSKPKVFFLRCNIWMPPGMHAGNTSAPLLCVGPKSPFCHFLAAILKEFCSIGQHKSFKVFLLIHLFFMHLFLLSGLVIYLVQNFFIKFFKARFHFKNAGKYKLESQVYFPSVSFFITREIVSVLWQKAK